MKSNIINIDRDLLSKQLKEQNFSKGVLDIVFQVVDNSVAGIHNNKKYDPKRLKFEKTKDSKYEFYILKDEYLKDKSKIIKELRKRLVEFGYIDSTITSEEIGCLFEPNTIKYKIPWLRSMSSFWYFIIQLTSYCKYYDYKYKVASCYFSFDYDPISYSKLSKNFKKSEVSDKDKHFISLIEGAFHKSPKS